VLGLVGFDTTNFAAFVQALASAEEEVRRPVVGKLPATADFAKLAQTEGEKKALADSLKLALDSRELTMRSLAALGLDKLGPDGAGAAPALMVASRKESNTHCRLQMLLALGEMGTGAVTALSARAEAQLDYFADLAKDLRAANKTQQGAAAVALLRLAPDTKQGKQALPVVAR